MEGTVPDARPPKGTTMAPTPYTPALGAEWLTPLYDGLCWLLRAGRVKRRLIDQARIEPNHTVLDLGCATATLTLMIAEAQPEARVAGLDPDPGALAIAARKARRADVALSLTRAFSFDLPFANESIDRVVSSLVFHHLTHTDKERTLLEIHRILKPAGELHVLDFGEQHSHSRHRLVEWFHHSHSGGDELADHLSGNLPEMFRKAGFEDATEAGRHSLILGSVSFYRGRKPEADAS
jgi:ubiquinone/menaquinone biosynthesis C-methylase UbiE